MKNKIIGIITLSSYALAFSFYIAGSYTTELTPWDTTGDLLATVGLISAIWGSIILIRK